MRAEGSKVKGRWKFQRLVSNTTEQSARTSTEEKPLDLVDTRVTGDIPKSKGAE